MNAKSLPNSSTAHWLDVIEKLEHRRRSPASNVSDNTTDERLGDSAALSDGYNHLIHHPLAWRVLLDAEWALSGSNSDSTPKSDEHAQHQNEFDMLVRQLQSDKDIAASRRSMAARKSDYASTIDAATSRTPSKTCDMPTFESSYTVNVGSQLKKMHNLRLIVVDQLDYYARRDANDGPHEPARLSTCMRLYSNRLQGSLLLIDEWDTWRGDWNRLEMLMRPWPELHFSTLKQQLDRAKEVGRDLQSGDVIITRHSNLRRFVRNRGLHDEERESPAVC